MNIPSPSMPAGLADARAYSGTTLALTGLGLWALQRYVFKSNLDPVFVADIDVLVPGVLGYLVAHYTRQATQAPTPTPTLFLSAMTSGSGKILPSTQSATTPQPAPATPLTQQSATPQEGASGPGNP